MPTPANNTAPASELPHSTTRPVAIVGAGLAGCECAMALARSGVKVVLFEMKPLHYSPAHRQEGLAELVCSNSLRSDEPDSAVGLLKEEMRRLGSLVMAAAEATRVPAGKALAVDRDEFSARITGSIATQPGITLKRRLIEKLDDPELASCSAVVLAAGPLIADALASNLAELVSTNNLYFYDAIAPIVATDSVDMRTAFRASRYQGNEGADDGDYLNCPLDEAAYTRLRDALLTSEKVPARDFEKEVHFEACLPIETLAERGYMTLAYGPLKPVGLTDPRTGRRPFAVLQLRAENRAGSTCNLVGCQTRLKYAEQERVFRLIPGLERAEFVRLGSMHRNTYVNAPLVLSPELELRTRQGVYLAGQLAGVEGYVESAACGLFLGLALGAKLTHRPLSLPPEDTALGALLGHLRRPSKSFQPSNVNYGLMPPLQERTPKRLRKGRYAQRARNAFSDWLADNAASLSLCEQVPILPATLARANQSPGTCDLAARN